MLAASRIAFRLDDPELQDALRRALDGRADLVESEPGDADVIVTDHTDEDFGELRPERLLRLADRPGRNRLDRIDPALVLSAAALIAAGYAVDRLEPSRLQPVHLSQRELQVAALLVDGASNKAIANALDISVHTAKFHVNAVLEKLGARNRADAVAIVLREGLVAL